MRIFLFEFVSGGGCFHPSISCEPGGTLLAEGQAMWWALLRDFAKVPQAMVLSTQDSRLSNVSLPNNCLSIPTDGYSIDSLVAHASNCDYTLLVAPEFDDHLYDLTLACEERALDLLCPDSTFIKLTSDKTRTCDLLRAAGVNTTVGELVAANRAIPDLFPFPVVAKRNDGAGSMAEVIHNQRVFPHATRIEQLVPGIPCSISAFCNDTQPILCPPMEQLLSDDGSFTYLGGRRLDVDRQIARCESLAYQTINALPPTRGYLGIDIVLGPREDGSQDVVVEINPRITTSYLGLRKFTRQNLADTMIAIAEGQSKTLDWEPQPVCFGL